jgi:hypothetical protein
MSTFRVILAFVFSLLIIGGIWKYYAGNEQVAVQDPFKRIWSQLANYTTSDTKDSHVLDRLPSTDTSKLT